MTQETFVQQLRTDSLYNLVLLTSVLAILLSIGQAVVWLPDTIGEVIWVGIPLVASPLVSYWAWRLAGHGYATLGSWVFIGVHLALITLQLGQSDPFNANLIYFYGYFILLSSYLLKSNAGFRTWLICVVLLAITLVYNPQVDIGWLDWAVPMGFNLVLAIGSYFALYDWQEAIESTNAAQLRAQTRRDELFTLQEELKRATNRQKELNRQLVTSVEVGQRITALLDRDTLLNQVVELIKLELGFAYVGIFLPERDTALVLRAQVGDSPTDTGAPIPLDANSLLTYTATTRHSTITQDIWQAQFDPHPYLALGVRSEIGLPLIVGGTLYGVLNIQSFVVNAFDDETRPMLQLLSDQVAIALHNAQLFDENVLARQDAEEANEVKSQFLANMSHELRTPLNGILGYAQILKRDRHLSPPQVDGLNIIYSSGQHLLSLINDVLDMSKIEARKMELHPEPVHLPGLLHDVGGIIHMQAQQKDILFYYDEDSTLPTGVTLDPQRLRQILLNLLGNAVKFTDKGQVTLRVSPRTTPDDIAVLHFEVEDTGVGMTSEQVAKIFLPFEQVGEARRRATGTGLGLAISQQLVEMMGGTIHVESESGRGSTFSFDIRVPLATIDPPAPDIAPSRRVVGYEGPRLSVLVVDDKEYNRALLVDLLAPLGFEIALAQDGQEEVEKAQEIKPDVIITDLVMPRKMGLEAVAELRALPSFAKTVIIAASASPMTQLEQRSLEAGCNAFVSKPISENELTAVLEKHLALEWVFEEESAVLPEADIEVSETLVAPPAEILAALHESALLGRMQRIIEQADELEALSQEYRPLALQLRTLANEFNDEQILMLLAQFAEQSAEG